MDSRSCKKCAWSCSCHIHHLHNWHETSSSFHPGPYAVGSLPEPLFQTTTAISYPYSIAFSRMSDKWSPLVSNLSIWFLSLSMRHLFERFMHRVVYPYVSQFIHSLDEGHWIVSGFGLIRPKATNVYRLLCEHIFTLLICKTRITKWYVIFLLL